MEEPVADPYRQWRSQQNVCRRLWLSVLMMETPATQMSRRYRRNSHRLETASRIIRSLLVDLARVLDESA